MSDTNTDSIASFRKRTNSLLKRKSVPLMGLCFSDVKKHIFQNKEDASLHESISLSSRDIRLLKAVKRHGNDPSRHTEITRRRQDIDRLKKADLILQSGSKFDITKKGNKSLQAALKDQEDSSKIKEAVIVERASKIAKTERGIWYHGTTDKLLKAILSQGLNPNPKQRTWANDDNTSYNQQSRASYGGIYVTQNLMTALGSARTARGKLGGNKKRELIIVMELQPRTFLADEDDLVFALRRVPTPPGMAENEVTAIYVYLDWKYGNERSGDLWKTSREEYIKSSLEWLKKRMKKELHPQLQAKVKEKLGKCWEKSLLRNVSHFNSKGSWERMYWNATSEEDAPDLPDKTTAEKEFASCIDDMTRILKDSARPSIVPDKFNKTARVMEPIKYKGSNRIVAVVAIDETERVGDDGDWDFEKPAMLKVYYGTLPQQFLEDYKQSVGSKFKVVKVQA